MSAPVAVYMPTTKVVRDIYVGSDYSGATEFRQVARDAFDRWLASHDQEVLEAAMARVQELKRYEDVEESEGFGVEVNPNGWLLDRDEVLVAMQGTKSLQQERKKMSKETERAHIKAELNAAWKAADDAYGTAIEKAILIFDIALAEITARETK